MKKVKGLKIVFSYCFFAPVDVVIIIAFFCVMVIIVKKEQ